MCQLIIVPGLSVYQKRQGRDEAAFSAAIIKPGAPLLCNVWKLAQDIVDLKYLRLVWFVISQSNHLLPTYLLLE